MNYKLVSTSKTLKDAKKLNKSGLKEKAQKILSILSENPYLTPPPYEKLIGELAGAYSRRINIQHRIVYQIIESEKQLKQSGCGLITNNLTNLNFQAKKILP